MQIYNRIGPNTGISYSLGGWLFFWFCVLVGALPFIAVAILFLAAAFTLAMILVVLLTINGMLYHRLTGRDARIPVPGSAQGSAIEYWMEERGWIRLPKRLMHTKSM